jgi:hypothetical protein
MRKNLFIVFSMILLLCLPARISLAKRFDINGLAVEVLWRVKRNTLIVWGDVEGKKTCNQINLDISFSNRNMNGNAYVQTRIRKMHRPGDRSIFQGEDEIYSRKHKNDWFIDGISVDCR